VVNVLSALVVVAMLPSPSAFYASIVCFGVLPIVLLFLPKKYYSLPSLSLFRKPPEGVAFQEEEVGSYPVAVESCREEAVMLSSNSLKRWHRVVVLVLRILPSDFQSDDIPEEEVGSVPFREAVAAVEGSFAFPAAVVAVVSSFREEEDAAWVQSPVEVEVLLLWYDDSLENGDDDCDS
jgi:hypothetical protein